MPITIITVSSSMKVKPVASAAHLDLREMIFEAVAHEPRQRLARVVNVTRTPSVSACSS